MGGDVMSLKHKVIEVVGTLSDDAGPTEITNVLLDLLARKGALSEFARLYREQMTAEQIAEYVNPPMGEFKLDAVVTELENLHPARESA